MTSTDRKLRKASRSGTDIDYFRERVRAGLVEGIEEGCRACGGVGLYKSIPYDARCMTCSGTGLGTVEERLRMAARLGHMGALEELTGRRLLEPLGWTIEYIEKNWGPVAAAAVVREASMTAFPGATHDRIRTKMWLDTAWRLSVEQIGETRAREAARQAGIRFALGFEPKED